VCKTTLFNKGSLPHRVHHRFLLDKVPRVCHALQDYARKLLVRYRAGHTDGANERTIIRIYLVAAKLVPWFYMYSSMYCSQHFSFSVHCEHRAEKQTGHVASCRQRSQKSATQHTWRCPCLAPVLEIHRRRSHRGHAASSEEVGQRERPRAVAVSSTPRSSGRSH
jgi:hypothetical protein